MMLYLKQNICHKIMQRYVFQGTGLYALEEHRYGPDGHLQTIGAGKYHMPTASSIPLQMNVSLLKDVGNPMAIYSSKVWRR